MIEKDIYKNRDVILGRLDERTKCIPDMQKDITCIKKKMAVLEIKSGIFGTVGGGITVALLYLKDFFIYGRQH